MDLDRVRAEQALLGAVLLDPAGQESVLDLVQPEDMRRPWHGQVLEAMQRARGRGALPCPAEVYAELRKDPDLPSGVSHDGVLVANLMEAVPRASHARRMQSWWPRAGYVIACGSPGAAWCKHPRPASSKQRGG